MTHKNMHDRKRELRILRNQARFTISDNVGEVRRKDRQLLRQWAVAGRAAFGRNSIEAYCDYITRGDFIPG